MAEPSGKCETRVSAHAKSFGVAKARIMVAEELLSLSKSSAGRTTIRSAGGVPFLVAIAREADTYGKLLAALALVELADSMAGSKSIVCAGGVEALIELLSYGTQEVRRLAAMVLDNLAIDGSCSAINEAGGVLALIDMARGARSDGQVAAAKSLRTLARDDVVRHAIRDAGAVEVLLTMVREGQSEAVAQAAGALTWLAKDDAGCMAIRKAGGVQVLIAAFHADSIGSQNEVVRVLVNLAHDKEGRAADSRGREVIATTGGVDVPVARLQLGTPKEISWAIAALGQSASDCPRLHAEKLLVIRDGQDATERSLAETALERLRAEKQGG